jgi:hypothetical protein
MKKISLLILSLTLTFSLSLTTFAEENKDSKTETPSEREQRNLDSQQRIQRLLPSQEALFDRARRADLDQSGVIDENERIRLADGDLEQELAPRLLSLLIGFSSILIMIFFVFAGARLILSRGDEEALTKTKQLIVQAVIGTFLIVGSFGIIVNIIRLFNAL